MRYVLLDLLAGSKFLRKVLPSNPRNLNGNGGNVHLPSSGERAESARALIMTPALRSGPRRVYREIEKNLSRASVSRRSEMLRELGGKIKPVARQKPDLRTTKRDFGFGP